MTPKREALLKFDRLLEQAGWQFTREIPAPGAQLLGGRATRPGFDPTLAGAGSPAAGPRASRPFPAGNNGGGRRRTDLPGHNPTIKRLREFRAAAALAPRPPAGYNGRYDDAND